MHKLQVKSKQCRENHRPISLRTTDAKISEKSYQQSKASDIEKDNLLELTWVNPQNLEMLTLRKFYKYHSVQYKSEMNHSFDNNSGPHGLGIAKPSPK